jgi:hypothetical protein
MQINIKRPDVVAKVRDLAALTGESLTDAVASAVDKALAAERAKTADRVASKRAEIAAFHAMMDEVETRRGGKGPDIDFDRMTDEMWDRPNGHPLAARK